MYRLHEVSLPIWKQFKVDLIFGFAFFRLTALKKGKFKDLLKNIFLGFYAHLAPLGCRSEPFFFA